LESTKQELIDAHPTTKEFVAARVQSESIIAEEEDEDNDADKLMRQLSTGDTSLTEKPALERELDYYLTLEKPQGKTEVSKIISVNFG